MRAKLEVYNFLLVPWIWIHTSCNHLVGNSIFFKYKCTTMYNIKNTTIWKTNSITISKYFRVIWNIIWYTYCTITNKNVQWFCCLILISVWFILINIDCVWLILFNIEWMEYFWLILLIYWLHHLFKLIKINQYESIYNQYETIQIKLNQ